MVGTLGALLIIGVCLGVVSVVLIAPFAYDALESMLRVIRIRSRVSASSDTSELTKENSPGALLISDLCINGIGICRLPARALMKLPLFAQAVAPVIGCLSLRIKGCNQRAVSEALLALGVLVGLLAFVLTQQLVLALVCSVLPLALCCLQAQKHLRLRRDKLRDQLPDALRGLGMGFMAGLSLEQAFAQTAEESQDPLKNELKQTVNNLRTGSSVKEALDMLDSQLTMDEMRFVSVALEIQHQTGGSMREVLDAAADAMLASFDLSRSLEVQTAQARLSARVVSLLPLGLVLVLSVAMEGYLATFFSSSVGFALLLIALAMEALGIVLIRKILNVNLETR